MNRMYLFNCFCWECEEVWEPSGFEFRVSNPFILLLSCGHLFSESPVGMVKKWLVFWPQPPTLVCFSLPIPSSCSGMDYMMRLLIVFELCNYLICDWIMLWIAYVIELHFNMQITYTVGLRFTVLSMLRNYSICDWLIMRLAPWISYAANGSSSVGA